MGKLASSPQPASGSVEQAMSKLTAQWYNAVTTACNLDPSQFQLFQGNVPVGDTSEGLWNIVDVVPPLSVNNYYDPSQLNRFSQNYGTILEHLKSNTGGDFEADMGDSYQAWKTYINAQQNVTSPHKMLQIFKTWAMENMNSTSAAKCYADMQETFSGPITVAQGMWAKAGSNTKAYDNTIEQLTNTIDNQKSVSFTMDSSKQSSDLSHSWANGSVFGRYDIFEAEASTSYDQITTQMTQAGIVIQVEFQHFLTFPLAPLAEPSDDPTLKNYVPWYNSAALALAYHTKDNTLWDNNPPTWEDFFGPQGLMQRTCSTLVIVDGINITMTSNAAFSTAQQTQVQSSMEVGLWPFFAANASGGWNHDTAFSQQGSITITQKCPAGNLNVLGALVVPIAKSFS